MFKFFVDACYFILCLSLLLVYLFNYKKAEENPKKFKSIKITAALVLTVLIGSTQFATYVKKLNAGASFFTLAPNKTNQIFAYEATMELRKFPQPFQSDPLVLFILRNELPGFEKRHPTEPPEIRKLYALALATCMVAELPADVKDLAEKELSAGTKVNVGIIPGGKNAVQQAGMLCLAEMAELSRQYPTH